MGIHKPTGDCPAVLGVETVAVDKSFSDRKDLEDDEGNSVKKFGNNRGHISMVEITGDDFDNWLETSGVLACGKEYSNRFPILCDSSEDR